MEQIVKEAIALEHKLPITDVIIWYKGLWVVVPLDIMYLHKN